MKMTLKSCHFYDSCQRLRTWELKMTITENKRTSKKLTLNKNLPVRETKWKTLAIASLEGAVLLFHTKDYSV